MLKRLVKNAGKWKSILQTVFKDVRKICHGKGSNQNALFWNTRAKHGGQRETSEQKRSARQFERKSSPSEAHLRSRGSQRSRNLDFLKTTSEILTITLTRSDPHSFPQDFARNKWYNTVDNSVHPDFSSCDCKENACHLKYIHHHPKNNESELRPYKR